MKSNIKIIELAQPLFSLKSATNNYRANILPCGYTKSILMENLKGNDSIEIINPRDSTLGGDKYLTDILLGGNPETIIFPGLWDYNFNRSRYIAEKLKEKNPDIRIIISGYEVSPTNIELLKDFPFDTAQTYMFTPLILKNLVTNNLDNTPAIFTSDAKRVFNDSYLSESFDIGKIPSPYLTGYLDFTFEYKFASILSKMGCVGECLYCAGAKFKTGLKSYRNLTDIINELSLFKEKEIKTVKWIDPTFNYPVNWFNDICELIQKGAFNKSFNFKADIRYEYITKETAKTLRKCNFQLLNLGLQSADTAVLEKIKRPFDIKKWRKSINYLKQEGLNMSIDIILGLLGDTLPSFKETVNFLTEEELINKTEVFLLREDKSSRLSEEKSKKIQFQKSAPHLILKSDTFSFEDLKGGINYAKKKGARFNSDSFNDDTPPLFTEYFESGKELDNYSFPKMAITKIIIDLDSDLICSSKFNKIIEKIKNLISSTLTIWFKGKDLNANLKWMKNILNAISKENPYTMWNIVLECSGSVSGELIDEIASSIFYYPTKLDYDSIYKSDTFDVEYLRTSCRFFIILNEYNEFNEKTINKISQKAEIYWFINIKDDINKNIFNAPVKGFLFDLKMGVTQNDIIKIMKKINKSNWNKKDIQFKNLYYQTIYNNYFNNNNDLVGYEERIFKIENNNIIDITFSDNMVKGKLPFEIW